MAILSAMASGISKGGRALIKAGRSITSFAISFASQGFSDSARITIDKKIEKVKTPDRFFAKFALGLFTYVPAYLVGWTVGPIAYFTYKNFLPFAKLSNEKLKKYTDYYQTIRAEELIYEGGPLKLYGLFGALLGLTLGTVFVTIPKIIFIKIPEQTWTSIIDWFANGVNIAESDIQDYTHTSTKRRFLSKFFGYIIFPLPLLAFIIATGGLTIIRFIIQTFQAIYNNTARGWNLAFFDKTEAQADIYHNRNRYQRFLGIPGLIIGLGTGSLVWASVTFIRSVGSSAYNFYKWASIGFSLPISDLKGTKNISYKFNLDYSSIKNFWESIKLSYAENVLGAPGYILAPAALFLGLIAGTGLRVALESWNLTLDAMTVLIAHIALRGLKNQNGKLFEETPRPENFSKYSPLLGFMGYPAGLIISTLPITIIGIVRYGATNIDSGRRVFNFLTSSILPGEEKFKNDNRPRWVKAFSAPGAFIGVVLGGAIRVTAETYRSFINTSQLWIKTSLSFTPKNISDAKYLKIKYTDRTNSSRAFGSIGYLIGAAINTPLVLSIGIARFILTNADSAKREFAKTVNPKLTEKSQITLEDDTRNPILKKAGYPGSFLGSVAGFFGLVSIESAVYFEYLLKKSTLLVLSEMDSEAVQNITPPDIEERKALLGLPGIFLGGIVGGINFVILGSGRVVFNTAQTIYHVTLDMVKFVRSKDEIPPITDFAELSRLTHFDYQPLASDDEEDIIQDNNDEYFPLHPTIRKTRQDKRKTIPFSMGLLGLPIGGVIGTVAAFTIGFFRIIKATTIRTFNNGLYYSRFALPEDEKYNLNTLQVKQESINKILGALGIVLGIPVGAIGFISLGTVRILVNTVISIGVTLIKIANLPPVNYSPDFADSRKPTDKRLGLLGNIIGLPLGLVAYVLRISLNVIYHSYATAKRDILNTILWARGDDDTYILGSNKTLRQSSRKLYEQHAFGAIGHIIGVSLGAAIGAIIISSRLVGHNIKSVLLAFQVTGNFVNVKKWDFADEYKYKSRINHIKIANTAFSIHGVSNQLKLLAGLPGIIIGGALASTFVIAPYYAKEFIKNNYSSYVHLSKSLINVGLDEFYFDGGVAADGRPKRFKAAGIFGYALASVTSGLVPLARYFLNYIVTPTIALVTFLPTAGYKIFKIIFYPRFDRNESDKKIQKIRNLYSSLENGELISDIADIKENADGRKGASDFMRKAGSLNINSLAEDILAAELECARNPLADINSKVETIKKETHAGHLFFTQSARKRRDREDDETIDYIRGRIEDYMEDRTSGVHSRKPNVKDRSFSSLFYHPKHVVRDDSAIVEIDLYTHG